MSMREARRYRLGRRGAFWAAASVLALVLWASAAPSVLYPFYAQQWSLPPVVITSVFATYQLSLLIVLPLFGNLSDLFGRRRVMIWGIVMVGASAIVFAAAPDVSFLYIGRVLQGAGSGLAMGAATASLVENSTSANPRFASSLATVATAVGLTAALVLSGVLAQFAPMPQVLSYIVLLVLAGAAATALALTPDDRPAHAPRWRPQALRLPRGVRMQFAVATLSVSLAYTVGAIFLSLGAHMLGQFTTTPGTAVDGLLLGCSSVAIGITALLLARVPPQVSVVVGSLLTVLSLALMAAAASLGSLVLFFSWCIVGGVAYAFAFSGGLGVINQAAPAAHRGATVSLLYLVAYALQAFTAIGIGALATVTALGTAVVVAAAGLGVLCGVLLVLAFLSARTGTRRGAPEQVEHAEDPVALRVE